MTLEDKLSWPDRIKKEMSISKLIEYREIIKKDKNIMDAERNRYLDYINRRHEALYNTK